MSKVEEIKKEYLNQLTQDLKYSISKFDSQSLYLSSGALGLSLAFIKDLVPFAEAKYNWVFLMSLWLFVLAIVIGFIGHLISSSQIMKRMKLVDEDRYEEIKDDNLIPRLNLTLITIIILGIFSLVTFVSINITNMGKSDKTTPKVEKIISEPKIEQLSHPVQALPSALKPTSQTPNSTGDGNSGKGGKK